MDKNKAKAILKARPPQNKKKLQSLIVKINLLRRFITSTTKKMNTVLPLLRLKNNEEMIWGEEQQSTFEQIK